VPDPQSNNYKWFVLAILTMVYTFNFIDRQILVILQEPIKAKLGLSDTQLGLLTSFSFAVVYVTAGCGRPFRRLHPNLWRRNLRYAMLTVLTMGTTGVFFFWMAHPILLGDISKTEAALTGTTLGS